MGRGNNKQFIARDVGKISAQPPTFVMHTVLCLTTVRISYARRDHFIFEGGGGGGEGDFSLQEFFFFHFQVAQEFFFQLARYISFSWLTVHDLFSLLFLCRIFFW